MQWTSFYLDVTLLSFSQLKDKFISKSFLSQYYLIHSIPNVWRQKVCKDCDIVNDNI